MNILTLTHADEQQTKLFTEFLKFLPFVYFPIKIKRGLLEAKLHLVHMKA